MNSLTDLLNAAAAALAELAQAVSDAQTMQDTAAAVAADWLQPESESDAQRHLLEVMAEAAYLLEGDESDFASAEAESE